MIPLNIGFIPLTDCAPLVVGKAKGFFAGQDLDVSLSREASWATVRDKVAIGALDAAHMLAPMTLAVRWTSSAPVTTRRVVRMTPHLAASLSSRHVAGVCGKSCRWMES